MAKCYHIFQGEYVVRMNRLVKMLTSRMEMLPCSLCSCDHPFSVECLTMYVSGWNSLAWQGFWDPHNCDEFHATSICQKVLLIYFFYLHTTLPNQQPLCSSYCVDFDHPFVLNDTLLQGSSWKSTFIWGDFPTLSNLTSQQRKFALTDLFDSKSNRSPTKKTCVGAT